MSAPGKGGKGGTKRHRKVLHDSIQGITKPAIMHIARQGEVKRINKLFYEGIHGVLKIYLEDVIHDVVTYTKHAQRKIMTPMGVVYVLKRHGRTMYGFRG